MGVAWAQHMSPTEIKKSHGVSIGLPWEHHGIPVVPIGLQWGSHVDPMGVS